MSSAKTFLIRFLVGAVSVALIAGCGSSSETTNKVPTPVDPNDPASQPLPTTTTRIDNRLPNLDGAAPINLVDKTNYTGLADLAQNVLPPLVGDALVLPTLTGSRSSSPSGKILVAFEDVWGFWGAELSSFPGTGSLQSNTLDMIFADDEFVLRLLGSTTNGELNANLYYRVRSSSDSTAEQRACKKRTVMCYPVYPPGYFGPPVPPQQCSEQVSEATLANECRGYISQSSSNVKLLGSFKGTLSSWLK